MWGHVRSDAHRVEQTEAGQQGRATTNEDRVFAYGLADELQSVPVRLDRFVFCAVRPRDRSGVQEVELEVPEALTPQVVEDLAQVRGDLWQHGERFAPINASPLYLTP